MAICLETTKQRWNGLSTDDKPISPEPAEGSEFHAVDTGAQYIFHNGMWEEDLRLVYALTPR